MLLYACTIFLSAFLLFEVQPMIGKIILPWFGGSAAVWSTCLLFFSSFAAGGLSVRALFHPILEAAPAGDSACAADGCQPGAASHSSVAGLEAVAPGRSSGRILLLLAATIGLPYILLSTTSPLLAGLVCDGEAGRSSLSAVCAIQYPDRCWRCAVFRC